MLTQMLARDWARRDTGSRAIHVTPKGTEEFRTTFPGQP